MNKREHGHNQEYTDNLLEPLARDFTNSVVLAVILNSFGLESSLVGRCSCVTLPKTHNTVKISCFSNSR